MEKPKLEELLARARALQEEIEESYRQAHEDLEQRRARLAVEFLHWQRAHRVGVFRFLAQSRPLVVLTAPVIYLGWLPFLSLDLFVTIYQAICFPVYGIRKVRRADYLVFDRGHLAYLNFIERFNCFYCSYGNGVAAYAREVAARTEQYWCPIKHARRIAGAHEHYAKFLSYGDAEAYRNELEALRKDLDGGE